MDDWYIQPKTYHLYNLGCIRDICERVKRINAAFENNGKYVWNPFELALWEQEQWLKSIGLKKTIPKT